MKFLAELLSLLLPNIIRELLKIKPTFDKSDGTGSTEKALKKKIFQKWGKK